MSNKWRFISGLAIYALLFFYLGVRVYFVFFHVESYDGWFGSQAGIGQKIIINRTDPNGPSTVLLPGDEFLSINNITPLQDPTIMSFSDRVPPGTAYTIKVRRNGQELSFLLRTAVDPDKKVNWVERFYLLVNLIFLLTGLFVFLLKPDDKQAWLLALMLGTCIALNTWKMPVVVLGVGVEILVSLAKIIGLWSLPLLAHFFLIFPDRSPILRRWPKLTTYLYWPFYICILPLFAGTRLPDFLKLWYFSLPIMRWFDKHSYFQIPMPTVMAYLAFGLICLVINYRVANLDARRRLRVIMFGSGSGFLMLLLVILGEFFGLENGSIKSFLEISMIVTAPLIPLSFAYAIIRHKVIPISLIIRRGVRYLLVSHGAMILEIILLGALLWAVMDDVFAALNVHSIRATSLISAVVAVIFWQTIHRLHRRYLAPIIDRRFFRESYDAQQILTELAQSVRTSASSHELLETVAARIQQALHVKNVTIFLRDAQQQTLCSEISFDYDLATKKSMLLTREDSITTNSFFVAKLRSSSHPLPIDNESLLLFEAEKDLLQSLNTDLLLPLNGKDTLLGAISLSSRIGDLPYSREDERLLMSVVDQTTLALENTKLIAQKIELEAENEQRAKELEEARQLQLSMLPKKIPQFPHLETAAYMKTATEVGGDYYDFYVTENGGLTIAIGDATGHGLKAGTVVTATKSLFNELAAERDLPLMLSRFTLALKKMNLRSMFMALTIMRVEENQITFSSAGMPPVLLYSSATGEVKEVLMKALPLGGIVNYKYKQETHQLASGDVIVLMSDGLPERFNDAGEMFDYPKIKELLTEVARSSPQEIINQFVRAGDLWAGTKAQDDDITFVVVKII